MIVTAPEIRDHITKLVAELQRGHEEWIRAFAESFERDCREWTEAFIETYRRATGGAAAGALEHPRGTVAAPAGRGLKQRRERR